MSRTNKTRVVEPEAVITQRRRRLRDRDMAVSLLGKVVTLILATLLLFGVIFGITPMKGSDMEPKFASGDLLLYYRLSVGQSRNELVLMERDGKQYVGRIIGLPGDTVNIDNTGTINVNGNNIFEDGIYFETKPYQSVGRYPLTLKDNEYFILADKRDTAKDSRFFGAVTAEELKGRIIMSIKRTDI